MQKELEIYYCRSCNFRFGDKTLGRGGSCPQCGSYKVYSIPTAVGA